MNNFLIDTHAHIYDEYYDDIDFIINKSNDNDVRIIINSGCDDISNKEVIKKVNKYDNFYATIGIHPENVDNYSEDDIKFIVDSLSNDKVLAIGEIGLDYHYTRDNKDEQIILFEKMLDIATKYDLPVVIHSREATLDTINVLKKYNCKGVIHSFSGSLETAREYIKMGFLLGVNGVVTFKNSNLKDVIKEVGLKNIILETDSPFLTPHPDRG